jgi:hypothetical protein
MIDLQTPELGFERVFPFGERPRRTNPNPGGPMIDLQTPELGFERVFPFGERPRLTNPNPGGRGRGSRLPPVCLTADSKKNRCLRSHPRNFRRCFRFRNYYPTWEAKLANKNKMGDFKDTSGFFDTAALVAMGSAFSFCRLPASIASKKRSRASLKTTQRKHPTNTP